MRGALVRVNATPANRHAYVKHVARDGSFTITYIKDRARRFKLETAAATIARLRNTGMTFSVCDAPGAV